MTLIDNLFGTDTTSSEALAEKCAENVHCPIQIVVTWHKHGNRTEKANLHPKPELQVLKTSWFLEHPLA